MLGSIGGEGGTVGGGGAVRLGLLRFGSFLRGLSFFLSAAQALMLSSSLAGAAYHWSVLIDPNF